jgi:hypothetical protein
VGSLLRRFSSWICCLRNRGRPESTEEEAVFQLEVVYADIVDMGLLEEIGIYKKGAGDNVAVYALVCRTTAGSTLIHTPSVWVYGAGKLSVKASLSYVFVNYYPKDKSRDGLARFWDSIDINLGHYLLEVPRGAEIVAGMLISDVPPDAGPGQTGE